MTGPGPFHLEVRELLADGEVAEAVARLHVRLRDEPEDAWSHLYLATLVPGDDEDGSRAGGLALKALALAPADLELLVGALEVLLDAGMVDEARGALQAGRYHLSEDTPVTVVAHLTAQGATVMAIDGDLDRAAEAFALARRLDPDNDRWARSAEIVERRRRG